MTHFKSWLTATNNMIETGEVNLQPSMTVPDQTMSLREILDRFARGLPVGGHKVPLYDDGENDLPNFQTLDLAERQELKEQIDANIRRMRHSLATQTSIPLDTPNPQNPDNGSAGAAETPKP